MTFKLNHEPTIIESQWVRARAPSPLNQIVIILCCCCFVCVYFVFLHFSMHNYQHFITFIESKPPPVSTVHKTNFLTPIKGLFKQNRYQQFTQKYHKSWQTNGQCFQSFYQLFTKMYVKHCEFLCMCVYVLFGIRKHLNDRVHDEKFLMTPGYLMHLEQFLFECQFVNFFIPKPI